VGVGGEGEGRKVRSKEKKRREEERVLRTTKMWPVSRSYAGWVLEVGGKGCRIMRSKDDSASSVGGWSGGREVVSSGR
jgi:hypothetical protein